MDILHEERREPYHTQKVDGGGFIQFSRLNTLCTGGIDTDVFYPLTSHWHFIHPTGGLVSKQWGVGNCNSYSL